MGIVYALCEAPTNQLGRDRMHPVPLDALFHIKIGFTTSSTADGRKKQCQTGNPRPLKIIRELDGTQRDEQNLHRLLTYYRTVGEWFRLPGSLVRAFQVMDFESASEVLGCLHRNMLQEGLERG